MNVHLAKKIREEGPYRNVLDLGCMDGEYLVEVEADEKIGVDIFEPYRDVFQPNNATFIHGDALEYLRQRELGQPLFDLILLMDVVEHLRIRQSRELVRKAIQWAWRRIFVLTPNGFQENQVHKSHLRFRGTVPNNPHQEHLCGWTTRDLEGFGFELLEENAKYIFAVWRNPNGD